jgi:hypothetical protein
MELMQGTIARPIEAHVIGSHLTCSHCGYDLHGQSTSSNCPECGRPVAETMAAYKKRRAKGGVPLNECSVRWLCHVARGVSQIFIAAGFAILAGWVGIVERWEFFAYAILTIPPWVIAAAGVWRLTAPEPGDSLHRSKIDRRTVRTVTVFFVALPLFMIRPGYLEIFGYVLNDSWCPYYRFALFLGLFAPAATMLLMWWCGNLARRGGADLLKIQFRLLALVWTPVMMMVSNVFSDSVWGFYTPLIYYFDVGGAAGVGHVGILAPELRYYSWNPWIVADGLLTCWALLLLGCLRVTLLKACIRPPAEPASAEKPQVLGGIG